MFNLSFSAYVPSSTGRKQFDLVVDGSTTASTSFFFNTANTHLTIPCSFSVENLAAGAHTIQIRIPAGVTVDSEDFAHLTVTETFGNTNGTSGTSGFGGIPYTSGFVNAGTFVTLDNLKCTVTTSGQRGLSIGAVSTSFQADVSGWYGGQSTGAAGSAANNLGYDTTASTSLFSWSFPAHGDTAQYHIRDKTNSRFYRVTMMIGQSYLSNFISIERLA
jgi:hypothetical protein